MNNSEQKSQLLPSASITQSNVLNSVERKLQNETGCKYGMMDCLYRMFHPKCFKCKENSEYEWDYTIGTV